MFRSVLKIAFRSLRLRQQYKNGLMEEFMNVTVVAKSTPRSMSWMGRIPLVSEVINNGK